MKIKFYLTSGGKSPVEEFLQGSSLEIRQSFFDAVNLLTRGQNLQMPISRNLSSIHQGLHELRLRDRSGQARIFYFVRKQDGIYMLHAIRKKSQELPQREIRLVLKRIRGI